MKILTYYSYIRMCKYVIDDTRYVRISETSTTQTPNTPRERFTFPQNNPKHQHYEGLFPLCRLHRRHGSGVRSFLLFRPIGACQQCQDLCKCALHGNGAYLHHGALQLNAIEQLCGESISRLTVHFCTENQRSNLMESSVASSETSLPDSRPRDTDLPQ